MCMTMRLMLSDYTCGKEVSDSVYRLIFSQCNESNAGSSLIRCQSLGRPAWKSTSEEQLWHQTLTLLFKDIIVKKILL